MFWFGLSAGCFALLLIHHAIRGAWALPIQRLLEAGTRTLLVMGLLFLVMFAGLKYMYPWANADLVQHSAVLKHRAGYLNPLGFGIRSIVTLALWGLFASVLLRS